MISTLILYTFYASLVVMTAPLRLFSDVALPAWIPATFDAVSAYLVPLDIFIPLTALFFVLAFVIVVEGSLFTYKLIRWVYRKIPGIS